MQSDDQGAGGTPATDLEQAVVDTLYRRLDELRARAAADLEAVRRNRMGSTHQSRSERDAYATMYEDRLAQLRAVEERLCFGRLDLHGGEHRYIGRIGLADDDQNRMLVDWRAEAATPFYQATAAHPQDVVRRRHLLTRQRRVTAVEDEVFDLEALSEDLAQDLAGEGALMAALNAQRTGRMGDIVATIQAEQDAIIRSDLAGVLVVEGGPGTGKTAVALHRAAYLLYGHRERLARSGVLVIGPSPVFLRYIEQVLPSLGETGVVMLTPGRLLPGVEATRHDEPAVAELKGDLRMAQAILRAVRDRQRLLDQPQTLTVEGREVVLTPAMVRSARDKARRTGRPHNEARNTFAKDVLSQLAGQLAQRLGLEATDRDELLSDLRDSIDVRRTVNLLWMPLTAHRVVSRLLADPDRLRHAAPWLSEAQISLLRRPVDAELTVEDVPLLDEAAELLGEDDIAAHAAAARAEQARSEETRYAREVLEMTGGGGGLVSAERLAATFAESGPDLTLAERAAGDRSWTYGHVVVDEAQELSPMMWRAIGRRNPTRSMTVVGDIAQTHAPDGARSWGQVLGPLVQDRWRRTVLTVSYRTPGRIMRVAAQVVADQGVRVPRSVREGDWPVVAWPVAGPSELAAGVVSAVSAMRAQAGGRLGVIAQPERVEELAAALRAAVGAQNVGLDWSALDREVGVLAVTDCKGLEFDGVIVVEPAEILKTGSRGANDLYVAMTRPTQQLALVHAGELPFELED